VAEQLLGREPIDKQAPGGVAAVKRPGQTDLDLY
jgi:hypothetical protein